MQPASAPTLSRTSSSPAACAASRPTSALPALSSLSVLRTHALHDLWRPVLSGEVPTLAFPALAYKSCTSLLPRMCGTPLLLLQLSYSSNANVGGAICALFRV